MKETVTLGSIYELQGFKEEALEIYKKVLAKNPSNTEAKLAVAQLSGKHKKFGDSNTMMTKFFVNLEHQSEFAEFERWLTKIWR